MMKPLYYWILFISVFLLQQRAEATHIMGSDIQYTCSNDTFTFTLRVYRDCNGNTLSTAQNLAFTSTSGCNVTVTRALTYAGVRDVTPVCYSQPSKCSGSFTYGIQEYTFTTSIVLNAWPSCCTWNVAWTDCCRNNSIGTITNPGSTGFYTVATINRCVAASNNSPKFSDFPVFLLCLAQDQSLNMSAAETIDLPRDSISYALVDANQAANTPVTYTATYNGTMPMHFMNYPNVSWPTPSGFHIDASTGTMAFRPTVVQDGVIAVSVSEWRKVNGTYQLIGSVRRDIQVGVVQCNSSQTSPTLPTIATQEFCAGQNTCINIQSNDLDVPDSTKVYWNEGIYGATFTTTNTTSKRSVGTLCWTPTNAHASETPYIFSVAVKDNSCPINLFNTKSYQIKVKGGPTVSPSGNITATVGSTVSLTAAPTTGYTGLQWKLNGSNISGATSTAYTASVSGTYTISATYANCTISSDAVNINFISPVSTFPYYEGFESSAGDWTSTGTNSSWQLGTPGKTNISRAANGTQAWATKLLSIYNANELSYLYSPYFDLSSFTSNPFFAFNFTRRIEATNDGFWLEYSENGTTWVKITTNAAGVNWYNNNTLLRWDNNNTPWHVASTLIPVLSMTNKTMVRFRFVFSSNGSIQDEGVGIDDIHIHSNIAIFNGTSGTAFNSATSATSTWQFIQSGTVYLAINPLGQNIGNVSGNVYRNTAAIRFHTSGGGQYYLDRNWKISTGVAPVSAVKVRLFFTHTEYNALRVADAVVNGIYDLGVTKYSGANQDNSLVNNTTAGATSFIPASSVASVIPYANGYMLEFSTSSFSEFWINGGGLTKLSPLPVSFISFDAERSEKDVLLNWITSSEVNSKKFEIERSSGTTNDFKYLNELEAAGNSSMINDYQFTDRNVPADIDHYYRLKQVDNNGTFTYSATRYIPSEKTISAEIKINPNPFNQNVSIEFLTETDVPLSVSIKDIRGIELYYSKLSASKGSNLFELQLQHLKPGSYILELQLPNEKRHFKILKY